MYPELTNEQVQRAVSSVIEHHSFTPPILQNYLGRSELSNWIIRGSTVITDHYVRLTPKDKQRVGALWNRHPLELSEFEIVLGLSIKKENAGEGVALWITEDDPLNYVPTYGSVHGNSENFKGIGIIMDTYDNDKRRNNPTIGLLYSGRKKGRFAPETDYYDSYVQSCTFDIFYPSRKHIPTVRVSFSEGTISVYISRGQEVQEKLCFTVDNIRLDFKSKKYYIGITGETSELAQEQDVVFLHTFSSSGEEVPDPLQVEEEDLGDTAGSDDSGDSGEESKTQNSVPSTDESAESLEKLKKLEKELKRLQELANQASQKPSRDDDEEDEDEDDSETKARKKRQAKRKKTTRDSRRGRNYDDDDDDDYDDDDDDYDDTPRRRRRTRR